MAAAVIVVSTDRDEPAGPDQSYLSVAGSASPAAIELLSAVADEVEAAPNAPGRYWLTKTRTIRLDQSGSTEHPYVIRYQSEQDDWQASSSRDKDWSVSQYLGAEPDTRQDVAAWRKDGRPDNWSVPQPSGGSIEYSSKPSTANYNSSSYGESSYGLGPDGMSVQGLQSLPDDPNELRRLFAGYYAQDALLYNRDQGLDQDSAIFYTAATLLSMQVPTEVRAALYRMMAGIDGVESLGKTTDAQGRTGEAVAINTTDEQGTYQYQVIIDPSSGTLMALQTVYLAPEGDLAWLSPDDVWGAKIFETIGWTDRAPTPDELANRD